MTFPRELWTETAPSHFFTSATLVRVRVGVRVRVRVGGWG